MKNSQRGFAPLVILIIIAVAAIGGGTFYHKSKVDVKSDITVATGTDSVVATNTPSNQVTASSSNKTNDNLKIVPNTVVLKIRQCNEMKDPNDPFNNKQNSCLRDLAAQLKDASICEHIIDVKTSYKQSCIERVEILSGNQNCEIKKDIDERGLCYAQLAKARKDEKICSKITSAIYKDVCYAWVAQEKSDITLCTLAGGQKDFCYIKFVEKTGNPQICENYSFDTVANRDSCYIQLVVQLNDKSYCQKIQGKSVTYANCQ